MPAENKNPKKAAKQATQSCPKDPNPSALSLCG